MKQYRFFMQPTTKDGVASGSARDLERDFEGLLYVKCEGLENVGQPKNIYTEDYAEQNGPRVFHPGDLGGELYRKETDVKITLLFVGQSRRATYSSFVEFISSGRLFFWDTARNKKVWLFLAKPVSPDMDYLGDGGCIKADFEFSNIWGIGKPCSDTGALG